MNTQIFDRFSEILISLLSFSFLLLSQFPDLKMKNRRRVIFLHNLARRLRYCIVQSTFMYCIRMENTIRREIDISDHAILRAKIGKYVTYLMELQVQENS